MRSRSSSPQPPPSSLPPPPRKRDRSPGADSATSDSKRAHSEPDDVSTLGTSQLLLGDQMDDMDASDASPAQSATSPPSPSLSDADSSPPAYSPPPATNRPDGPAQLAIINEYKRERLVAGDSWYLVSRAWFRRWSAAASGTADDKDDADLDLDQLGPVDNAPIATEGGTLRMPVQVGVDCEVLPETAWAFLTDWYGLTGPTFERTVIGDDSNARVEFYPPSFALVLLLPSDTTQSVPIPTDPAAPPRVSLSVGATVTALCERAQTAFHLQRAVRLWRLPTDVELNPLPFIFADALKDGTADLISPDDSHATLSEAMLDEPLVWLAVEQQDPLGNWLVDADQLATARQLAAAPAPEPEPVPGRKGIFGGSSFFGGMEQKTNALTPKYKNGKEKGTAIAVPSNGNGNNSFLNSISGALTRSKPALRSGQRGVTGLSNLGNTCFMNSALQCMSNTKELQEYFNSGVYKSELNRDNPLGMKGHVAEAFGQLLERLWSPTSSGAYAPREFKQALSKFAPSFSGYGQQDSQELLAFLLDGTHEDLNRIKKKPATSAPDWMGGGDAAMVEMARVCWEQYRSRNDSVIVDLFQGQYRSTVVCPDCDKVSITFDPFMYVTVNIPNAKKWRGEVYLVPEDITRPRYKVSLELPRSATLKTIKAALGAQLDVKAAHLIVFEEWHGKFYKSWWDDDQAISIEKNDSLIFVESSAPFPQPKPRNYGKAKPKPPVDPNAPIIIAVSHTHVPSKREHATSYGRTGDEPQPFGIPFVLTLTPEEASTQKGIYMALARQYSRVSKQGDDLIESADDHDFDLPAAPSTRPAPAANPTETRLPETPPPESESTDIVVDVQAALPDEDSPRAPSPARGPGSSNGAQLFAMHVSRQTLKDQRLPFAQADWGGSQSTVPLVERVARQTAAARDAAQLPTPETSTAAPSTPTPESDAEDVNMASPTPAAPGLAEPEPEPEAVAPKFFPLVRTGDFIVTEWAPAPYDTFFGGENDLWSDLTLHTDPDLLAERAQKNPKKQVTLEGCLTEFTKEERLGEDDMWYCPDCKKHQPATKAVELWKVPDVLVFALKRFSAGKWARDKIEDYVDFPIEGFNMEQFVQGDKVERRLAEQSGGVVGEPESLIYDLYAVDNHYGGMGGGHYTAYAKNPENDKWYDFDDSRVSPINDPATKIKTSAAYLLFYRRRTTRPIGAKSRQLVDSALQSRNASASNSDAGGSPSRPSSPRPGSSLATASYIGGSSYPTYEYPSTTMDSTMDGADDDDMFGSTPGSYPLASRYPYGSSYNNSTDDLVNFVGTGRTSPAASDTGAEPGSPIHYGDLDDEPTAVDVTLEEPADQKNLPDLLDEIM